MLTDVQIAHSIKPRPIEQIAAELGLWPEDLLPYGRDVAKVELAALRRPRARSAEARLILVSAITPTAAGEGKTTTTIGLGQALRKLGHSACLALREPSLGPYLGAKGGATGGGYSQIIPAGRINLHFTGDFHAITSAHNLLAALLDNHLYHGNRLRIDPRRILWRRVLDMNDRALRNVILGLGGARQGVPRESGFDITAASEVMAILCLAEDFEDLRRRLDRVLVAFTYDGEPVTAGRLKGTGAMLALLRDAVLPNLVQTLEGTPAFIHGGPFANIAHGCNSVLATRMARHHADWAITEAGFGFDLGAEKFFDIKCTSAGLATAAVVLVATIRALKQHGGLPRGALGSPDAEAVRRGLPNLAKHVENIEHFGRHPIVALNRFQNDTEEELEQVRGFCRDREVPLSVCDHHARGGEGALDLARLVIERSEREPSLASPLYRATDSIPDKVLAVAKKMYGAGSVTFTKAAQADLLDVKRLGYAELPICIAKTHSSLSDEPGLRGRPSDFEVTVRNLQINAGAGFLVILTGDMLRMPGLPPAPLAEQMDVIDGTVVVGTR